MWQSDFGVPFPAFARAKVRGDVRTAMRRIWRYEERRMLANKDRDGEESVNDIWDNDFESQVYADEIDLALNLAECTRRADLSKRETLYLEWLTQGRTPREMAAMAQVSTQTVITWHKCTFRKMRSVLRLLREFD